MTGPARSLAQLPTLGPTIVQRLAGAGIRSRQNLARVGPARAYRQLCANAGGRLPVCYYLYSLEAALRGIPWTAPSTGGTQRLRRDADGSSDLRRSRRRRRAHSASPS